MKKILLKIKKFKNINKNLLSKIKYLILKMIFQNLKTHKKKKFKVIIKKYQKMNQI